MSIRAASCVIQFLGRFVKCSPNNASKLVGGYYHANKYVSVISKRAIDVAYVKANEAQRRRDYNSSNSHVLTSFTLK